MKIKMISKFYCALALILSVQLLATVKGTPIIEGTPTDDENTRNDLKIICHYHLHSWYAPGYRDYSPEVIDESQCTHIVYTDRVRYTDLSANQSLHDGKKLFYDRIPVFRTKGINVSITFFKFNGYEFARMIGDNTTERDRFVTSLVEFMERNDFSGFDLFWGCRSCSKNQPRDVRNDEYFMDLMRQLSESFKPRGWLLSTFVSLNEEVVNSGFDVKKLSEYVDWMTVNPVEFSRETNATALVAPLYFYPGDARQELTANFSVNYLIEKGVPSSKLVLPVTSMGLTYRLTSENENGVNAPSTQRTSGYFYEYCRYVVNDQWKVVHDSERVGSYAYNGERWTTYNDVEDVQHRAEYIIQNNLAGGSIFNLNYDDFEGKCGCGTNPLLKALVQVLRNVTAPKLQNCT